MTETDFLGDSGEYEYISEAVEITTDVPGMLCEIGLREGKGTALMIDGVRGTNRRVISIDPFGSIIYQGREGQICRLDYTNQMRDETVSKMYQFLQGVNWQFFNMTDSCFFEKYKEGVEWYDIETEVEYQYSLVHFDGPHYVYGIIKEIEFFLYRTSVGGIWIFDDASPDFYDHDIIDKWVIEHGFEKLKHGHKKAMYRKVLLP